MCKKLRFELPVAALMLAAAMLLSGCDYIKTPFNRGKMHLESKAAALVTEKVAELDPDTQCQSVRVRWMSGSKRLKAKATLSSGKEIDITIRRAGKRLTVAFDRKTELELIACPLVNRITCENFGGYSAKCVDVRIDRQLDGNTHLGTATLANGNKLDVAIIVDGDDMHVQIL